MIVGIKQSYVSGDNISIYRMIEKTYGSGSLRVLAAYDSTGINMERYDRNISKPGLLSKLMPSTFPIKHPIHDIYDYFKLNTSQKKRLKLAQRILASEERSKYEKRRNFSLRRNKD